MIKLVTGDLIPSSLEDGDYIKVVTMIGDADYYLKEYVRASYYNTDEEFVKDYDILFRLSNEVEVTAQELKSVQDYIRSDPCSGDLGSVDSVKLIRVIDGRHYDLFIEENK